MTAPNIFYGLISFIIAFACIYIVVIFAIGRAKEKKEEKIDLSKPIIGALVASLIIGVGFSYICADSYKEGDYSNYTCSEYLCNNPSTCKLKLSGYNRYFCSKHENTAKELYESTHSKVSSSSDKNTVECKSCHRKFNKDSENAKSIARTNMCTNCYNNFNSLQKVIKEQPVK